MKDKSAESTGRGPRPPKAAALRYKSDKDSAPRVVAAAQGDLARKIIEVAVKSEVPVYQNTELVEILSRLEYFEEIPPVCYRVVAEILYFVYKLNDTYGKPSSL